ncbi:helix-turn-helix transcriptional regulator [Marinobacter sp. NFXS11]|uniref:helix-turn-helix domain-containing protein n=1 Tax=Marinobacter sp. NFXS11 TaxID=2818432 RepID=UPI0032DFDB8F
MNYWTGTVALICLCIGVILLFASLSWFVNRQQDRLPMAYLLALVCLVILQSLEFMYQASNLMERFPFFLKLFDPLIVMMPFCIFGYIRAIQGDNALNKTGDWWLHAAPMILVAVLAIPFWSMPGELKVYWMFQGRIAESLWQPITLYGNSYLAVIGASSLFYWWLQRKKGINTRKAAVREWVRHLQLIQLIIAASMTFRIIVYFVIGESFSVAFVLAPTTAYLTYLLLTHAHPPMHIQRTAAVPLASQGSTEQSNPALVDETDVTLFKELGHAMEKGLFRENTLTLRTLAETCGTTTHQASAAINLCAGSNFYEWVNGYRIKAACEALNDTAQSVSEICYEVGFNSKSTFNTAFRKQVGCTPTEYRKKNLMSLTR